MLSFISYQGNADQNASYHFTSTRMANVSDRQYEVLVRMWRNWLVGMQNGAASLENNLIVPQKVKRRVPI